jgi:PAS domain S-box-containing protein
VKNIKTSQDQIIDELIERGVINAISGAVSIQDTKFKILYQNEKAKAIIGDHVGEYCYEAFENKSDVCEDCTLALSLENGKVYTTERHNPVKKDLIVEITTSAIRGRSGDIIAGMEVVRDISQRKKLEESLLNAKQDWEETFDTINEAITIHDRDFNIIRANKAAEEMLGEQFTEILKHKCYKLYHGKDTPPESCPSCRTLITGEQSTAEVFEPNLNKSVEITALPRFDSNNELIGLIHIVRDITKRKALEAEREMLIEKLQEALARVKSLRGLLPICCSCNKIRDKEDNWNHVDVYLRDHSEADITHGLCPDCEKKHFPQNFNEGD